MNNLKSERVAYLPNVNSLMKISLGLIFFTILSTAFVYAETISDDSSTHILKNAHLQDSTGYLDNSLFSITSGSSLTIVNDDVVSHKFVSGNANSELVKNKNYDTYLICELGEKILPTSNKYSIDNMCDFNKDNRIITNEIFPGESLFVDISDIGNYRLIDPDYPWIELLVYVFPDSESSKNVNSGFAVDDKISEQTPAQVQTISVDVNGILNDVKYSVRGMTVTDIESDIESASLIFFVGVTDLSGRLNVEFDRTFFDSVYDGVADPFFILADGDESVFEETETKNQSRTLSITVPYGTEELEIIGSVFSSSVEEIIVEEIIVEEIIVNDVPDNECGPGTILENNVCVLDQRCGPGTILEGNACVLDSTLVKSSTPGHTKELIMSVTTALGIAGIIGIILAIIARANKNKN